MNDDEAAAWRRPAFSLSRLLRVVERCQSWVLQCLVLGLIAVLVWAGLAWTRDRMTQEIYADRLRALAENHEALRSDYDRLMEETALTQIVVSEGNEVSVRMSLADGQIEEVSIDADPSKEIYVDYVLLDNRLWIRRVFDADTPPSAATLLDWDLKTIDWSQRESSEFGKAVYRSLEPGVWEITMTGNGSLSLGPAQDRKLSVQPYPEISDTVLSEEHSPEMSEEVSLSDIWQYWKVRCFAE
ncbi:MAG: hypothetical protein ACPGN3_10925 [Opitutales bacterium]